MRIELSGAVQFADKNFVHRTISTGGRRNFFFYHGFADLLRHIRILSILRAHFGLIRCIHRQINARGRLAYRLVITGKYA